MQAKIHRMSWEFRSVFRIAYKTRTHADTVVLELHSGPHVGRGEALGVSYHGETLDTLCEQLEQATKDLTDTTSREELLQRLPPGGARHAIDSAIWDLEAKRAGQRAWQLAGLDTVRPLTTAFTLGIDTPNAMAQAASAARQYHLLKAKLTGADDLERVRAIRNARPDARLIVDANQAWSPKDLETLPHRLAELRVELIEQPLPAGQDDVLSGFDSPIPLCADESCQTTASLDAIVGRYSYINIKLDKAGGLTEGLRLAQEASRRDLKLMVGCMAGSSLAMAPAFIVGQLCDYVDLDGPLLAKSDVPNAMRYEGSTVYPPEARLWG